ncbi:MAG TPA: hypothetical protein DIC36_11025 [Gammaproteobacteria bacterium]|jgi:hypothetical protein|nr:hypothetical protein [Gammaproteobacteria bacterium]
MEHRWSRRLELSGEVLLAMSGGSTWPMALADLSVGGMGVVNQEFPLPVNSFVTVSFWIQQRDNATHHRVLAQVVHSRPDQTGLMFIDPGAETLRALRAVQIRGAESRVSGISVAPTHAA